MKCFLKLLGTPLVLLLTLVCIFCAVFIQLPIGLLLYASGCSRDGPDPEWAFSLVERYRNL